MGLLFSGFADWLVAMLGNLVAYGGRYLLARVILAFGIGIVTMTGVSTGISGIESLVTSSISATSSTWISSLLGLMGFDSFVNIIFSAYFAKLAFMGLSQGGSISRMFIKGQE